jgi:hypothetical protein
VYSERTQHVLIQESVGILDIELSIYWLSIGGLSPVPLNDSEPHSLKIIKCLDHMIPSLQVLGGVSESVILGGREPREQKPHPDYM